MFAQPSSKYLIDAATLIAGLEGQEGSPESACLDILWMLLESNQIEVLILADEWDSLSSHIHKKVKEPKRAEALLNRIRRNIKPVQDDKDERMKLLYFAHVFKGGDSDLVSIQEVVAQHTANTSYSTANAAVDSLVFIFSIWLTKELFGIQLGKLDTWLENLGDFLGIGDQRRQTLPAQMAGLAAAEALSVDANPRQHPFPLTAEQRLLDGEGLAWLTPGGLATSALHNRRQVFQSIDGLALAANKFDPLLQGRPAMAPSATQLPSGRLAMATLENPGVTTVEAKTADDHASSSDAGEISRSRVFRASEPASSDEATPVVTVVGEAGLNDIVKIIEELVKIPPIFSPPDDFNMGDPVPPSYPVSPALPASPTPAEPNPPNSLDPPGIPASPIAADWIQGYTFNAAGQLSSLLLDTNGDGRIDWVNLYTYDENGDLTKQLADIQGDGRVDYISFIENDQLVAFLADTNNDSIFDLAIATTGFDEALLQRLMADISTDSLAALADLESQGLQAPATVDAVSVDGHAADADHGVIMFADDALLQGGADPANVAVPSSPSPALWEDGGEPLLRLILAQPLATSPLGEWLNAQFLHPDWWTPVAAVPMPPLPGPTPAMPAVV
jgi:hypothetical protein